MSGFDPRPTSPAGPGADPASVDPPAAPFDPVPDDRPPVEPAGVDLDQVAAELAAVEAAIGRLDDGTYGRCQVCTDPLDDEQLAADPTVRVCHAHLDVVG